MHLSKTKRLLIAATLLSLLQLSGWAQAPGIAVHGTVLSDKGAPVEGASVIISGSSKGTVTNSKGVFTLSAPADALLVITFVGYDTAQVRARATVQVEIGRAHV